MALAQLLGNVPRSQFMEQHYLKLPFALAGGCREFCHLGTWELVERILMQPEVDLVAGREGEHWPGKLPQTLVELRELMAAGYMLGIRHAERHEPGLANLAASFHRDFVAPIDIHLFCTPANHPGYGWHYDAEEVFMLQLVGGKEWWLRKNTVNPWPLIETLPADMRYDREIMPAMHCTLAAGDWLYVPGGYWHRTQTGEASISLSVGVQAPSGIDVLDFLRGQLLDSLRWRQRLPALGEASTLPAAELQAEMARQFIDLGQDVAKMLSRPQTVAAFLATRGEKPA